MPVRLSHWLAITLAAALAIFTGLTANAVGSTAAASTVAIAQPGDANRVTVTAATQRTQVTPGDRLAIAITFEFAEHMHIWPNVPVVPKELDGLVPVPTEISLADAVDASPVRPFITLTQWPAPQDVKVAFGVAPISIKSYAERTTVYVPVVIDASAKPGAAKLNLSVRYQACNETVCFAPEEVPLTIDFTIVAPGTAIAMNPNATDFAGFDPSVFGRIDSGDVPVAIVGIRQFDFLGYTFGVAENAYALILLIAFAAGVLMNFTPCVLPVVPIKIISIQNHAKTPSKMLTFGLVYCLGIIAMYGVLGLLAFGVITGGQKFDWGQIFTVWWFVVAMSLIVGVMGIGMLGLFTINLPSAVYSVNPTGDTLTGNFVGGVLTGILAVPCTGPLLGATLAWILTQPAWIGFGVFLLMGAGMAAPYMLLISFPKLLAKMPRGGPGSELLKQVMGGLMVAVAAFLAGNLTSAAWPWFVVGAIAIASCVWLIIKGVRTLRTATGRSAAVVLGVLGVLAFGGMTYSLTKPPPIAWRTFISVSDDVITQAIEAEVKAGRTVVVDFTAKWCTNCHVIEKNIIYAEESLVALRRPDVVAFKVDLTPAGDNGWGVVRQISGGGGIPLFAVFGPKVDKPIYFQSFFKPSDLVAAIDKASGTTTASLVKTAADRASR
jgi:thiol:disulfide interchange protein